MDPDRTCVIYCCGCRAKVNARLTDGAEVYPHRPDLAAVPVWKCDGCGNHVGCHHKTDDSFRPLGSIPTPALRSARTRVHSVLDPLWKSGRYSRSRVYKLLTKEFGWEYHTAGLRSVEDADRLIAFVKTLEQS